MSKLLPVKRFTVTHAKSTVNLFALASFIFFLYLGIKTQQSALWSGFWINLAASVLILLATINFIEYLFERDKKNKWRDAKDTADDDLNQFSNMLTSYILSPFGFSIDPSDSRLDPDDISKSSDLVLTSLLDEVRTKNLIELLDNLDKAAWQHMSMNLTLIKAEFTEYFQLYQDIMSPETLGKLLKLHKTFKKFHNTLGLVYVTDILWSGQRPELHTMFIASLADDLNTYFEALRDFKAVNRR